MRLSGNCYTALRFRFSPFSSNSGVADKADSMPVRVIAARTRGRIREQLPGALVNTHYEGDCRLTIRFSLWVAKIRFVDNGATTTWAYKIGVGLWPLPVFPFLVVAMMLWMASGTGKLGGVLFMVLAVLAWHGLAAVESLKNTIEWAIPRAVDDSRSL